MTAGLTGGNPPATGPSAGEAGPRRNLSRDDTGRAYPDVEARFVPLIHGANRLTGWLAPIGVTLIALALRLWHLGQPNIVLFDETYYAKDAYSLWRYGYARDWSQTTDVNKLVAEGHLHGLISNQPTEIVHPDGGKWLIGLGEQIFGMNSFGWRVASAVIGALTILVLCRLVRRLTGSTLLGCVAGLLLTFDGLHFVMSRLALLDVFLGFWLVCGTACLVADRDWGRARLARRHPAQPVRGFGPVRGLLLRPWRIGAGTCFGLACGTKWSGVYVLAVFAVLAWLWDINARRAIGVRMAWLRSALVDGIPAFFSLIVVALAAYLATWTSWLIHYKVFVTRFGTGNYGAPWGSYAAHPATGLVSNVVDAFKALWHFHVMVYDFHTGSYLAHSTHPYQSNPIGWLLMNRPVGIDAQTGLKPTYPGCDVSPGQTCLRQILALGNPVLWWAGAAALLLCLGWWVARRDWRFSIPVLGVATTWLPWFLFDDRPIFFFYAVVIIPFTVIGLTLALGKLLGGPGAGVRRRRVGVAVIVGLLALEVVAFAFFYPIWADSLIPTSSWQNRIWFTGWI